MHRIRLYERSPSRTDATERAGPGPENSHQATAAAERPPGGSQARGQNPRRPLVPESSALPRNPHPGMYGASPAIPGKNQRGTHTTPVRAGSAQHYGAADFRTKLRKPPPGSGRCCKACLPALNRIHSGRVLSAAAGTRSGCSGIASLGY